MKLLGIFSILLFLSFLAIILNIFLFYLPPFASKVQCYFHGFLHQCMVKGGLMIAAFQIIATILHGSSSQQSDKISAGCVTHELCLLEEKQESSNENVGDDQFSMQQMKPEVVEGEIDGINANDGYPENEGHRNQLEKNGLSGNDDTVDGHGPDENTSGHEIKETARQDKTCCIGDPHNNHGIINDAEDNGESMEEEDEEFKVLERRSEEFIARSYRRWKEELLEENYNDLLPIVNDSSYYLRSGLCEAQQRTSKARISRLKNANSIIKRLRFQAFRSVIHNMHPKAKMIKMRRYKH